MMVMEPNVWRAKSIIAQIIFSTVMSFILPKVPKLCYLLTK